MKRNELEPGKVYAYSRHTFTPSRAYQISQVVIHDTEPNKFHKGEVQVKAVQSDGTLSDTPFWVSTRKIVGVYQDTLHEFQLAEKNSEIARLKKEIREKENRERIERLAPDFKDYGVSRYDIRLSEYGSNNVTVSISLDKLQEIATVLRYYPMTKTRNEELHAQLDALRNPQPTTEGVAA